MYNVLMIGMYSTLTDRLRNLKKGCEAEGLHLVYFANGLEAMEYFKKEFGKIDAVITGLVIHPANGFHIIRSVLELVPDMPIVLSTGAKDPDTIIKAMKAGVKEYLIDPVSDEEIIMALRKVISESSKDKQLEYYKKKSGDAGFESSIVIVSPASRELFYKAQRIASSNASVFISGESGVGKNILAQYIHEHSGRRGQPFLNINCAGFPQNLLESELFGYEKGAFTGASETQRGFFETANRGTLFLDEIDAIDEALQRKLLKAVEEKEFYRVGGRVPVKIDVRIISATNSDIEALVAQRKFREDLYYRLNTIQLHAAPLRERPDDILPLCELFLKSFCRQINTACKAFSGDAVRALEKYSWPGNIRELRNMMERISILSDKQSLSAEDLVPFLSVSFRLKKHDPHAAPAQTRDSASLKGRLADKERAEIVDALEKTRWNKTEASKILGLKRTTLSGKIKKYGIK